MSEENESGLSDDGLELDTIDFSSISKVKSEEPVSRSEQERTPDPEPAPGKTRLNRRNRYIGPVVAISLLVSVIVLAFLFSDWDLKFFLQSEKQGVTAEDYLQIGPISATLPNGDIIRLTVDIGCRNDSEKKRLAMKESMLRNQIVSAIVAPETGRLFEDQRYDEIKAQIKRDIEKITENPVGEVYFSELQFY
jgi:flagellar basal body-associated protein FliL